MSNNSHISMRLQHIYAPLVGAEGAPRLTSNTTHDFGGECYEDTATYILSNNGKLQKHIPHVVTPLKSGDLVKVFKSVTKGEIAWHGTVDLDFTKNTSYGDQKGTSTVLWDAMFTDEMPARLTKDGQQIFGIVANHTEQGDIAFRALYPFGKGSTIYNIEDGDELIVYSKVLDGDVEWQGSMTFTPDRGAAGIQDVNYTPWSTTKLLRTPQHMPATKWMEFSYEQRPVLITPAKI